MIEKNINIECTKENAALTYTYMRKMFNAETKESIRTASIYTIDNLPPKSKPPLTAKSGKCPEIKIVPFTPYKVIDMYSKDKVKIDVVNPMSFTKPCEGFLEGKVTQENILCQNSNLYNILSHEIFAPLYKNNKDRINIGLNEFDTYYIPDVIFANKYKDNYCYANVISCAPPDINMCKKYKVTQGIFDLVYRFRLEMIRNVFMYHESDVLIFGDFGFDGNDFANFIFIKSFINVFSPMVGLKHKTIIIALDPNYTTSFVNIAKLKDLYDKIYGNDIDSQELLQYMRDPYPINMNEIE